MLVEKKMRLIVGILVALLFILIGYFALPYDLKGYILGAFGVLLGAFIYYTSATTSAANAIEYTTPYDGAYDIMLDNIRTFSLIFISGFLISKVIDISMAGILNVYMIEVLILFLLFSYISFWELKYTIKNTLKAMFMLDAPTKFL